MTMLLDERRGLHVPILLFSRGRENIFPSILDTGALLVTSDLMLKVRCHNNVNIIFIFFSLAVKLEALVDLQSKDRSSIDACGAKC